MATNLEIITDALRELNVISEIDTPSAEQGAHALRKLNDLLEAATEDGIDLGYYAQTLTTDNCPIPKWSERGVKLKLALELAPVYGSTVSAELASKLDEAWSQIVRKVAVENLKAMDMSSMPLGEGHGVRWDITRG
jgi:hypothetical protein